MNVLVSRTVGPAHHGVFLIARDRSNLLCVPATVALVANSAVWNLVAALLERRRLHIDCTVFGLPPMGKHPASPNAFSPETRRNQS